MGGAAESGAAESAAGAEGAAAPYDPKKTVWVIGEIGGGTKYFSETAMRGVYRMLKEAPVLPDHLIFNGGILPEIPTYATKGGAQRLMVLENGINILDDAVVSVKPSLDRIIELIKTKTTGTQIHYVMGPEDIENTRSRNYDRVINAYDHKPEMMQHIKESYVEKIKNNEIVIKQMQNTIHRLEEKSASDPENARLHIKMEHLRERVSQYGDETDDYREIVGLYIKLQAEWMRTHVILNLKQMAKLFGSNNEWENLDAYRHFYDTHDKSVIFGEIKAMREEYKAAARNLDKLNEKKDPEQYKKAEEKVKRLANLLKKVGYEKISKASSGAERASSEILESGEIFTHNIRASHDVEEIVRAISEKEILTHIRNAFGRKYPLSVTIDGISGRQAIYRDISAGGFVMRMTNNPTVTSKQTRNNITQFAEKLLSDGPQEDRSRIRLLIGGHAAFAEVEAVPLVDRGHGVFVLMAPPLVDVDNLASLWKEGIKTVATSMYERAGHVVSSGFWEATLHGPQNKFTYHTFNEACGFAEKEMVEERRVLASKFIELSKRNEENGNGAKKALRMRRHLQASAVSYEEPIEVDDKDRLQIVHKMPSEWNAMLFNKFLAMMNINPKEKEALVQFADSLQSGRVPSHPAGQAFMEFIDRTMPIGAAQHEEKLVRVGGISDIHIGASGSGFWTPQDLTKAYLRRQLLQPKKTDAFIFGGDIIDSNYKMHNFEKDSEKDHVRNVPRFERFIKELGLTENEQHEAMDRYKAHLLDKQPIYNVGDQQALLGRTLEPLFGVSKDPEGPSLILVAGNHYNKKSTSKELDEATTMANVVDPHFDQEKVSLVYGGDYGVDYARVKGETMLMAHFMDDKIMKSLRVAEGVRGAFAGDIHKFDFKVFGDKFIATIPAGAYTNMFPRQIGIPSSTDLRGFSNYEIALRGGVPVRFAAEFVTQGQLEQEGYLKKDKVDLLIEAFEKDRLVKEIPMASLLRRPQADKQPIEKSKIPGT